MPGRVRSWRSPVRISAAVLTVVWLGAVLVFTDCSHTTPHRAVPSATDPTPAVPKLRLLLIGDAGFADARSPVLRAANASARRAAGRTVALFLGDNIYPAGLPESGNPERLRAEAALYAQLGAFDGTDAKVYFTPGNHDWSEGRQDGRAAILRQQAFIAEKGRGRSELLPRGAEPGPACVEEAGLVLVFVDVQWWIHEHDKPRAEAEVIREQLKACLKDTPALIVTHHPPETHGVHGGYFTWQDHVFPLTRLWSWAYLPLPVIGSLYPAVRGMGVSVQDAINGRNQAIMRELGSAFEPNRPLAWVAGHEHSLQVLRGTLFTPYTLVSGSGSKTAAVTHAESTLYAHEALGFMELLVFQDERVLLVVHAQTEHGVVPTFRYWLEPGADPSRG